METYYEKHKEERKEYQQKYRVLNLQAIRKKDQERKRKKNKGEPKVAHTLVFRENVVVSFD
jgi:hypothetical protein